MANKLFSNKIWPSHTAPAKLIAVVTLLLPTSVIDGRQAVQTSKQQKITFATRGETLIQALVQIGSGNGLPLGLVLGFPGNRTFCEAARDERFEGASEEQVLKGLLDQSKYSWAIDHGVIHISVVKVPSQIRTILGDKISSWSTPQLVNPKLSMQEIGVFLHGYIHSMLYPDEGQAGSFGSSSDADEIEPFTARDATIEEIADSVVSQGGKGVWLLYADKTEVAGRTQDGVGLKILSYVHDRGSLEQVIRCGAEAH